MGVLRTVGLVFLGLFLAFLLLMVLAVVYVAVHPYIANWTAPYQSNGTGAWAQPYVVEESCNGGLLELYWSNGSVTYGICNGTGDLGVAGLTISRPVLGYVGGYCVYNASPVLGIDNGTVYNGGYSIQLNAWVVAGNGSRYWLQSVLTVSEYEVVANNEVVKEPSYLPTWCYYRIINSTTGLLTCGGSPQFSPQPLNYPLCGTLGLLSNGIAVLFLYNDEPFLVLKVVNGTFTLGDITLVGVGNDASVYFNGLNASLWLDAITPNGTVPINQVTNEVAYQGSWTGETIMNATVMGYGNQALITAGQNLK